ncbi:MAG: hypothetical protein K0S65_1827 [Labilithrix sp.]|nr:hypothetical protein [Labilithrix sp.]
MTRRSALLLSALTLAAAAGCYTGSAIDTNRAPGPATSAETDGTDPTAEDGTAKDKVAPTGLPCDVAEVLSTSCSDCHGARLTGGAPNRLLSYEDLTASSESDPSTTVAELSLARMKSTKRPMPPDGKLESERIAVLEKWIESGMPKGSCNAPEADAGTSSTDADAGSKKDAAPPATSVCTSGSMASASDPPSALMKPGKACIKCHSAAGAPAFEIAGTVYPTLHEPNDCDGVAGVKVLIIDAVGNMISMTTNAAGNFQRISSFPRPYRAMIVKGNNVREMKTPQFDGDCNGCHTEWGDGAPGRVMAP